MNWFSKYEPAKILNFDGCEDVKGDLFWISESKETFKTKGEAILKNKADRILHDLIKTSNGEFIAMDPGLLIKYILENYDVKPKSQ